MEETGLRQIVTPSNCTFGEATHQHAELEKMVGAIPGLIRRCELIHKGLELPQFADAEEKLGRLSGLIQQLQGCYRYRALTLFSKASVAQQKELAQGVPMQLWKPTLQLFKNRRAMCTLTAREQQTATALSQQLGTFLLSNAGVDDKAFIGAIARASEDLFHPVIKLLRAVPADQEAAPAEAAPADEIDAKQVTELFRTYYQKQVATGLETGETSRATTVLGFIERERPEMREEFGQYFLDLSEAEATSRPAE